VTLRLDRKPEGAKLLRVELETDGGLVRALKVRGDFFAHPEEIFEEAEDSLRGLALSDLGPRALLAFSHPGLSLYGASAEGIAETLVLAAAPALGPDAG
jgi:lipoate-protein ligase A